MKEIFTRPLDAAEYLLDMIHDSGCCLDCMCRTQTETDDTDDKYYPIKVVKGECKNAMFFGDDQCINRVKRISASIFSRAHATRQYILEVYGIPSLKQYCAL
jgi:hypothetical protein